MQHTTDDTAAQGSHSISQMKLPTFPDHVRNYSPIFPDCDRNFSKTHLRCNNCYYVIFSRLLLPYIDSFPSPFSSVHALNICEHFQFSISHFLKLCSFQQSNFWNGTLLHHYSHTTRRIHTICSLIITKIPPLPWFSLIKSIPCFSQSNQFSHFSCRLLASLHTLTGPTTGFNIKHCV